MSGVLISSFYSFCMALAPIGEQELGSPGSLPKVSQRQHLAKLYLDMKFLPYQNRNLMEGKKLMADISVCICNCSCRRKKHSRLLEHMPTARGWWRTGLEDRGRVAM